MITFSIIKKSQLEGLDRLDAEFYQSEYLKMANKLRKVGIVFLREHANKINRGCQPIYNNTEKILAMKSVYVRNDFLNEKCNEFVDNNFYEKNKKAQINKLDVLLNSTGVGTLGRSNYYYLDKKAVADGHVTIIRTNKELNPIYLDTFLKTKYGQFQIDRLYSGSSGQIEIYPHGIGSIELFLPNSDKQEWIASICEEAHDEEKKSKLFYQQAENLLLENLELNGFNFDKDLSAEINFLEVLEAERFDAEYFQKKYKIIEEKIKKYNASKLGDLVSIKKGIEVGAEEYQKEGKIFIRVSSMTKFGIVESDQKYLSEKLYEKLKKDFEPKIGEILLTKDATPGIAYVLKNDTQGIISGGTLRLKLKDGEVEGEYLTLCLNSLIGQMQAQRDAGGSVIAHWKPEQIKNVLIPILPRETQVKISELVKKSFESRKIAKELLEEAKRKVEEMIEKEN